MRAIIKQKLIIFFRNLKHGAHWNTKGFTDAHLGANLGPKGLTGAHSVDYNAHWGSLEHKSFHTCSFGGSHCRL